MTQENITGSFYHITNLTKLIFILMLLVTMRAAASEPEGSNFCIPSSYIAVADFHQPADTAKETWVEGRITDAATRQPLAYASVTFDHSSFGTSSGQDGYFKLYTRKHFSTIKVTLVGYKTLIISIQEGTRQTINPQLRPIDNELSGITIKSARKKRYRNKDNPAVELIRKVIAHKENNRPGDNNYLQYNEYERIKLYLTGLSDKLLKGKFYKRYGFIVDTATNSNGEKRIRIPLYMSEKKAEVYYRKQPEKTIKVRKATKQVNLNSLIDSVGLDIYLNRLYGNNINIYDNNIFILTNQFLSPIADHSPDFYKFFITDTIKDEGAKIVEISFVPRNKGDLLFEGNLQVMLDSSYAIKSADLWLNKRINLNFLKSFRLHQEFSRQADNRYYLEKSDVQADFGLMKNKKAGLFGDRMVILSNYKPDKPMPEKFYEGKPLQFAADSSPMIPDYWKQHRGDTLSKHDAAIYAGFDSLSRMPSYRRTMWITKTLVGGYADLGPVELGPDEALYSFNNLEGKRISIGGRTTPLFNKNIYLEGYGAYGFKDRIFKYYLSGIYSFNQTPPYKYPNNYIKFGYQYDTDIPGKNFLITQTQSLLASFSRHTYDLWIYNKIFRAEYIRDFENHISIDVGAKWWNQQPADQLRYIPENNPNGSITNLTTTELNIGFRYAPHEQFFQGTESRHTIPSKYPILNLQLNYGLKGVLNGSYSYANLSGTLYKRFYLSQLGYTDVMLLGGVVTGKLPFPLLAIMPANETYLYNKNEYNMMNFMEFISDHYAGIDVTHCFSGFLLNKVPLIRRFNLREYLSFKVLYGGLRNANNPLYNTSLYKFPLNAAGQPLTYALGSAPYVEAGVGVGNIFKFIRIDGIRRFNYLNHPGVGPYGLRFSFIFDL